MPQWITVPPQGYGGIQWVASTLIDGLLGCGVEVLLLGAPGSPERPGLTVSSAIGPSELRAALDDYAPDLLHDHSNNTVLPAGITWPIVSTHHLNGIPARRTNGIYVSEAQRRVAGSDSAPVIRLPVNPERCLFSREKGNYLLYLGRVSAHKGVHEAAAFAKAADLPLKVAGPSWEHEYLEALLTDFQSTVEYLGEVGGTARTDLIAYARALLVLSQPWGGPFGGRWSEPGSTVVAEASVSGTPVIASDNGCLPEIVPGVGHVLSTLGDEKVSAAEAQRILATLPSADVVRAVAVERWGHVKTAREYLAVYRRALLGSCWT